MTYPAYTQEEDTTRRTFLALMWSLSYPGRVYDLPETDLSEAQIIGDTLLDLETSFYVTTPEMETYLGRNGARNLSPERAAYHFYPSLTQASIGTLMYPDQSATLIIGCALGAGQTLQLSGPGIPADETTTLRVAGIPTRFWELRDSANRYPRGWDVYLVSDRQVVGLPRTTQIMLEG
jgi:alpha-D-ribose 1-methylphosphonate 5-triphosphate synthase subunit PhnH